MSPCFDKAILGAAGFGLELGIDKLSRLIKNAINKARKPGADIAPMLTTIENVYRSCLSPMSLTTAVISRLGEAGVDTSVLPNGEQPGIVGYVRLMSEEIVKELQLHSKITGEIPPGILLGTAAGVPVLSGTPTGKISCIMQ